MGLFEIMLQEPNQNGWGTSYQKKVSNLYNFGADAGIFEIVEGKFD